MYKTPELPPPPRRLPIIAGAFAIACLCYGATQALTNALISIPLLWLILPAVGLCVTYAILAEYLASSGGYEKDRVLNGLALLTCPISGGTLVAGLYLIGLSLEQDRRHFILPPPTLANRLGDLMMRHFALVAILPWLAALAIALFCGLQRRAPRAVMVWGIVDPLPANPASGDRAP